MKKKNSMILILTTIITLLPIIVGVMLYDKLPEQIPSHFNFQGEVDAYMAKNAMIFGMPLGLAALNVFVFFMLNADPKKENADGFAKLIGLCTAPFISCMIVPISMFHALGYETPIHIILPCFIGVLFILLGNYMPKVKQNYTVGIKIPWTLNDENNWNKTHRLSGILYVIGGIILIISSLAQFTNNYTMFFVLILCTVVPYIYSYSLYKKGNK